MRKTAKRVVSLVCAIAMLLTTCGTLGFASGVTADEVAGLIDDLISADVSHENWSANADAVIDAAEQEALLEGEELATYQAMVKEGSKYDGELYSAILDEFVLIVVYEKIMCLPEPKYNMETGAWEDGITAQKEAETYYQKWYEYIVDLGLIIDTLSTEQQRVLGESVLARYSKASEECEYYWSIDVKRFAEVVKDVYDSNVAWATKNDAEKLADYQRTRAQYEKALEKVEDLYTTDLEVYKDDQLDDVNTTLVSPEIVENGEYIDNPNYTGKKVETIFAEASAYINGIYESSIAAIEAIRAEIEATEITIENCAEIYAKADDGVRKYIDLEEKIGTYLGTPEAPGNAALKEALISYKEASQELINVSEVKELVDDLVADVNEDITKENYSALVRQYEAAFGAFEGLTDEEKLLDPALEIETALINAKAKLDDFADTWIEEVKALIAAIPSFDYDTRLSEDEWKAAADAIDDARQAYDEINFRANALVSGVDNYAILTDAEARKAQIEADYAAAWDVVNKIRLIGKIGNLAEDNITLESRTAIDEADVAYDALTGKQQELVTVILEFNAEDFLNAADAECATLEAKKAEIEAYIAEFYAAKELVTYTTEDAAIEAAVADANAAYDAAEAIFGATDLYGDKLKKLECVIKLEADKPIFDGFVAAIADIKAKGDTLVAAVDVICALVDIRNSADLEARLIAYSVTEDKIKEMTDLLADASKYADDYGDAVADAAIYDELPVEEEPYKTYAQDKEYSEEAIALWGIINPLEDVEEALEWAEKVVALYDRIEEACSDESISDTVAEYDELAGALGEQGSLDRVAQNYLYIHCLDELSKFDYIRIRINQHLAAKNIIKTANNVKIPDRPEKFNCWNIELAGYIEALEAYKTGVEVYEKALSDASVAITKAYLTYENSDAATKEIPGVNEAYVALQAKEAECTIRNAALAFDKKVIRVADTFATTDTTVHDAYEEVDELKEELSALAPEVNGYSTSYQLLLVVEIYAVEDLIAAIGDFGFDAIKSNRDETVAKIEKARSSYDILLGDPQKVRVRNYDVLLAAEEKLAKIDAAIAFIDAVNALPAADESNWEVVKAEADDLMADHDEFDEFTKSMVEGEYTLLQDKQAQIVSFMLSLLPDLATARGYVIPADMAAIDDVLDLLCLINHTDAEGNKVGAYNELTAYSKLKVKGYQMYELIIDVLKGKLEDYNLLKAAEVIEAIDAIGYLDAEGNITMTFRNYKDYKDDIDAAKGIYKDYIDDIEEYEVVLKGLTTCELDDCVTKEAKDTLKDADIDYDIFATAEEEAAPVKELLDTFYTKYPTTGAVNRGNYDEVQKAITEIEDAYENLGSVAKRFVEEGKNGLAVYMTKASEVGRYMAVVEAIHALMYKEDDTTTTMYDDIVNNQAFDAEYGLKISTIEAMYEGLTADEKAEVDNLSILKTARAAYDENVTAAIATTIEKIEAIYAEAELENFAFTNAALYNAIDEANDWFNALSEENQAKVTNADRLEAANEKYASLTDPAVVIVAIDDLGDPEEAEITDENYAEITVAVEEVRALYETLAADDKAVVDNYSVLTAWEEKVASFEPDHSADIDDDGKVTVTDISAMVSYVLRKVEFTDEQFARANLVEDAGEQVIDIFDILAAIELITF